MRRYGHLSKSGIISDMWDKRVLCLLSTVVTLSFALGQNRCIHHVCIYYPFETRPSVEKYMSSGRCRELCRVLGFSTHQVSNDPVRFRGTNSKGDICEVFREDDFLKKPVFECQQGYVIKMGHGMKSISRELADQCVKGFVKNCGEGGMFQLFDLGCSGAPPDPENYENPFHEWVRELADLFKQIDCPKGTRLEISVNQTYGKLEALHPISEIQFVVQCLGEKNACVEVKFKPCEKMASGSCSRPGQYFWCQGQSGREARLCCIVPWGEKYIRILANSELKCPPVSCSSIRGSQCMGSTGDAAEIYRSLPAKEVLACIDGKEQRQLCCKDICGYHAEMQEVGKYSTSCKSQIKSCPKDLDLKLLKRGPPSCQISLAPHSKSILEEGESTNILLTVSGHVLQTELFVGGYPCPYEIKPTAGETDKLQREVKPLLDTYYTARVIGCTLSPDGTIELVKKQCEGRLPVKVIPKFNLTISSDGPGNILLLIEDAKGKRINYEGTRYSGLFLAYPRVTVKAIPSNGARFRGWFGTVPFHAKDTELNFILEQSLNFYAAFELAPALPETLPKKNQKKAH